MTETLNLVDLKLRLNLIEKQLADFREWERRVIESVPKSMLPADWPADPPSGSAFNLLLHLFNQEVLQSIGLHQRIRFWFAIAMVEFILIDLLIAILFLKR